MLLEAGQSLLLVVDVQEGLAPAVAHPAAVIKGSAMLIQAAARLGVPVVVSEQYPRGLGRTVGELLSLLPSECILEKLHFSCAADPALLERLESFGRRQVVIVGMEAHVCVLQTALDLKARDWRPFVVRDAVSSRTEASHAAAMDRLTAAGVSVGTVEMVMFEWLHRAGTSEFKELSRLVK